MKQWLGVVAAVAALGTAAIAHSRLVRDTPSSATQGTANGPRAAVLIELFTSEGCSSCPPADALLAAFVKNQPVAGAEIVALKEHVDYWDHLGWKDPFSSHAFTERQESYARAFGNYGVYTPQMVVDGEAEFVGSAESKAERAIAHAAAGAKSEVRLIWKAAGGQGGALALDIRIEALRGARAGDAPEVFLAITEDNLHSDVRAGENAGRGLDHVAVVRRLALIGKANPQGNPAFATETAVKLDSAWQRKNLRAIVFVQERNSRHVLGTAAVPVRTP